MYKCDIIEDRRVRRRLYLQPGHPLAFFSFSFSFAIAVGATTLVYILLSWPDTALITMVSSATLCAVSSLLFSSFTFALPRLVERATISPDGTCGGTKGYTCQGSNYGNSCGKYNLCGRDTGYSEISNGCQPAYGFCYSPGSVSPDGSCGGTNGFICLGSNYGNSCGPNNKCGSDAGYSGTG